MKTCLPVWSCLFLLFFSGCLPEERFWWSPDGSRAAVVVNSQIHLATPDGELSPPLSEKLQVEGDLPRYVSWLPDGSGFVLHRIIKRNTWEEMRELLPAEEASEVERYALGMPGLLAAAVAMSGDGDPGSSLLAMAPNDDRDLLAAAFFCALAKNKAVIESTLQASLKGAEFLAEMGGQSSGSVHEICLVKLKGNQLDGEPFSLVRSLRPMVLPAVSPKLPAVAYWRVLNEQKRVSLEVCTLDGKSKMPVGETTNGTFGWTADGRSLVYAAPVSDEDSLFQNIRKVTVLQESGSLLEKTEPTDLAAAILPSPPRLCTLPDGRVLFASQPMTLPSSSDGLNLEPRLYVVSADGKSVTAVPTAPGDLPTNLSFFAASPDGKRVAVVESDTDAVAVVELATGKTDIVSPAHPHWHCRTMPAWRSATELTFAALDGPEGQPRWMLWAQGKGVRAINSKWSPDVTARWLEKKEPQKDTP